MLRKVFSHIKKCFRFIPKFIDDLFLAAGITFLSIGVFQIYIPAGYITLGICFLAFAYLVAKRR